MRSRRDFLQAIMTLSGLINRTEDLRWHADLVRLESQRADVELDEAVRRYWLARDNVEAGQASVSLREFEARATEHWRLLYDALRVAAGRIAVLTIEDKRKRRRILRRRFPVRSSATLEDVLAMQARMRQVRGERIGHLTDEIRDEENAMVDNLRRLVDYFALEGGHA